MEGPDVKKTLEDLLSSQSIPANIIPLQANEGFLVSFCDERQAQIFAVAKKLLSIPSSAVTF
jgi:hypothetical protein